MIKPILLTFVIANSLEDGDVRLVDGNVISEGRVDIFYNGQWGTVCNDNWDINNAIVVCRQLDYFAENQRYFGGGTGPIYMDDVNCTGNEESLNQCEFPGWGLTLSIPRAT